MLWKGWRWRSEIAGDQEKFLLGTIGNHTQRGVIITHSNTQGIVIQKNKDRRKRIYEMNSAFILARRRLWLTRSTAFERFKKNASATILISSNNEVFCWAYSIFTQVGERVFFKQKSILSVIWNVGRKQMMYDSIAITNNRQNYARWTSAQLSHAWISSLKRVRKLQPSNQWR